MANSKVLKLNEAITTNKFGDAIIGVLEGPCADLLEGTRNGRMYTKTLWEKVFASDKFQEYMNNGGVIGELDHPETRVETLLKEAAIKMSEKPYIKDGVLMARFDILNTPNGQIAKTLAKAGISLGISSRGNGETYMKEGKEVVDENSFDFEAFDLVYLPAVKSARMKLITESKKPGLKESLERLVESANDNDKKIMMKTLDRLGLKESYGSSVEKAIVVFEEESKLWKTWGSYSNNFSTEEEALDWLQKISTQNKTLYSGVAVVKNNGKNDSVPKLSGQDILAEWKFKPSDITLDSLEEGIKLGGGMSLPYDTNYCIFSSKSAAQNTILVINSKKEFNEAESDYGSFVNVSDTLEGAKKYIKTFTGAAKDYKLVTLNEGVASNYSTKLLEGKIMYAVESKDGEEELRTSDKKKAIDFAIKHKCPRVYVGNVVKGDFDPEDYELEWELDEEQESLEEDVDMEDETTETNKHKKITKADIESSVKTEGFKDLFKRKEKSKKTLVDEAFLEDIHSNLENMFIGQEEYKVLKFKEDRENSSNQQGSFKCFITYPTTLSLKALRGQDDTEHALKSEPMPVQIAIFAIRFKNIRTGKYESDKNTKELLDEESFYTVCLGSERKYANDLKTALWDLNKGIRQAVENIKEREKELKSKFEQQSRKKVESKERKNLVGKKMAAESDGALMKDLQEAIEARIELEDEKVQLLEKLSAGNSREAKLKEEVNRLKSTIRTLSEKSQKAEAKTTLVERLKTEKENLIKQLENKNISLENSKKSLVEKSEATRVANENKLLEQIGEHKKKLIMVESKKDFYRQKLEESTKTKDAEIKKLKESIDAIKHSLEETQKASKQSLTLTETLKKDANIKINNANKKLEEALKTNNALVGRLNNIKEGYISSICRTRGFNVDEFKSKLPQNFTSTDVNILVERMQTYHVRLNDLPFNASNKVGVRVNGGTEPLLDKMRVNNPDADISDDLLDAVYRKK